MHQHTIGFLASPSDTSAKLVQLRETEPLRALDHHHGGVRDIDADLNHGRGHKDIRTPRRESIHVELFDLAGLLSVHDGDLVRRKRESGDDILITSFKILIVNLFTLEYQGIDNKHLTSGGDLFLHEIVKLRTLALPYQHSLDRLSARRHLIDDRDIQVTIECHRQRPWNRSGGHGERVDVGFQLA